MSLIRRDVTAAPGPIMSRAVIRGDTVYLSGLVARDRKGDIRAQTRDILEQIDGYLERAGSSRAKLLQANLWITDMANFRAMNEIWNGWVDPENPPVRACVQAGLAHPDLLVEIMVTAAI